MASVKLQAPNTHVLTPPKKAASWHRHAVSVDAHGVFGKLDRKHAWAHSGSVERSCASPVAARMVERRR